jgi:hypothetical protein
LPANDTKGLNPGERPRLRVLYSVHCRELLQEATKETEAVVDLKKPSLPSFSSVEFLVHLRLIFFRVVSCLPAVVCEGWAFRGQPCRCSAVTWRAYSQQAMRLSLIRSAFSLFTKNVDVKKKAGLRRPYLLGISVRPKTVYGPQTDQMSGKRQVLVHRRVSRDYERLAGQRASTFLDGISRLSSNNSGQNEETLELNNR